MKEASSARNLRGGDEAAEPVAGGNAGAGNAGDVPSTAADPQPLTQTGHSRFIRHFCAYVRSARACMRISVKMGGTSKVRGFLGTYVRNFQGTRILNFSDSDFWARTFGKLERERGVSRSITEEHGEVRKPVKSRIAG